MIKKYQKLFAEMLRIKTNLPFEEIMDLIEIPPENIPGDLAFPCFHLAKSMKKAPVMLAQELAQTLQSSAFEKFENNGPYINAYINKEQYINNVYEEEEPQQGKYIDNKNTKVLIEYMGANPNKPLHIGHIRNVCIGDSLRRIFDLLGYDLTASTYGDDSGVNVGYNIVGHLYYGIPIETEKKFDHYCGEVYTKMKEKNDDPEFKKILSETLLKIEEGKDQEVYKIHQEYTKKCAAQQLKTCRRIGASFDVINRETDILHLKFFAESMELLRDKGYIKYAEEGEAKGCRIIDLSSLPEYEKEEKQYQILIKSDGVATYIAKDIAFAMRKLGYLSRDFSYRVLAHEPNGNVIYTTHAQEDSDAKDVFGNYNMAITIIDNRQIDPQEVVKSSLKLLGYLNKDKQYIPLGYGIVYLTPKTLTSFGYELNEEEKAEKRLAFASRKGRTVTVDEILQMLHEKAYRETKERNPEKDAERLDETSEKIAVSSLRFFLLRSDVSKDITFDVDEALDMQGETGAYILYTGARIQSILDNNQIEDATINLGKELSREDEFDLMKTIGQLEETIFTAQRDLAPHLICRYLLSLCKQTNAYYANCNISKSEEPAKSARLLLMKKISHTLKHAMQLVGMEYIERM